MVCGGLYLNSDSQGGFYLSVRDGLHLLMNCGGFLGTEEDYTSNRSIILWRPRIFNVKNVGMNA